MNWSSYFSGNKEIAAEKARAYLLTANPESLQLVDVRQPAEYEREHITGAILLPLAELPQRLTELDAEKETIVYCRSGSRSAAACQILRQHGFNRALNMAGGLLSWNGLLVAGGPMHGINYFLPGDFFSVLTMTYQMEDGLQDFYLFMAANTSSSDNRLFFELMAQLEDGHKAKLHARHPAMLQQLVQQKQNTAMEGGFNPEDFTSRFDGHLDTPAEILHLAMMFEAQAYDLYSRLAQRHDQPEINAFFMEMAEEENKHLARLSKELDKYLV